MSNPLAIRVLAFVTGDQLGAEDLVNYPDVPRPLWLDRAAKDEHLASYALEAAIRSAERANLGLSSIQEKATSFLGSLLIVIPIGLAATGFVVPKTLDLVRVASLLLAVLGDVFLVSAAFAASFAAGLVIAGGLNIAILDPENTAEVPALQASEADAWHYSAVLARESGRRRAFDLFQARRLALLGVVFVGAAVLVSIVAGTLAT
jgi:hypothetical protein